MKGNILKTIRNRKEGWWGSEGGCIEGIELDRRDTQGIQLLTMDTRENMDVKTWTHVWKKYSIQGGK